MKYFSSLLVSCGLFLAVPSGLAQAASKVTDVRIGGTADYQRIVFDISGEGTDIVRSPDGGSAELVIDIGAEPPQLRAKTENGLLDMGVFVEPIDAGTRIRVERIDRRFRLFRLEPNTRLVIDMTDQVGTPFAVPADADRIPTGTLSEDIGTTSNEGIESELLETVRPAPVAERAPEPRAQPEVAEVRKPKRDLPSVEAVVSKAIERDPNRIEVFVRDVAIEGVGSGNPTVDELLALEVELSPVTGGYVVPRIELPLARVPIWAISGEDRMGRTLTGPVLQEVIEAIADAYSLRGKVGTKVDIKQNDLDRLTSDGSDGLLVIRVQEVWTDAGGNSLR